jgi:hypothetical protein
MLKLNAYAASAALAVFLLFDQAAAAPPVPVPVQVTNVPLPVEGAVTVEGTVPTRDVDHPASQPFQHQELIGFGEGLFGGQAEFTVPEDKRLIIEFVTFELNIPTGQRPTFNWVAVSNESGNVSPLRHYFPLTYQATTLLSGRVADIFIASSPTRLYADPGTTVQLAVRRDKDAGTGAAAVTVSGHFVDVPQSE